MSDYSDAKVQTATVLMQKIGSLAEKASDASTLRRLAESYALVNGTLTGRTEVKSG